MDPTGHCTNSVVTCWIQHSTCILPPSWTGGGLRPTVQVDDKMHVECWIQQVTTRVGAVTCWIQQSVSLKQVVGFSCLFNSEVDQLISKVIVHCPEARRRKERRSEAVGYDNEQTEGGIHRRPLKGLIGNATTFCAEFRGAISLSDFEIAQRNFEIAQRRRSSDGIKTKINVQIYFVKHLFVIFFGQNKF